MTREIIYLIYSNMVLIIQDNVVDCISQFFFFHGEFEGLVAFQPLVNLCRDMPLQSENRSSALRQEFAMKSPEQIITAGQKDVQKRLSVNFLYDF